MEYIKKRLYFLLRGVERYTKFDMVYVAKSGFWVNLNFFVSSLASLALSIAFAHFLSKETYGVYQFVLSTAGILTAFSLSGSNSAVTQSVARGLEGSFKQSIPLQFKWSILSAAGALGISGYYFLNDARNMALYFLIVALFLPLTNVMNTYLSYLTGKKDFRRIFSLTSIYNVVYIAAMVAAVAISQHPFYIILVYFVVNAALHIFLHFRTLKSLPPNNEKDPELYSYSKHLSFINFLGTIAQRVDAVLVYHFLGAADLAIYAFAKIIPDKVAGLFKSIVTVTFPKFSVTDPAEIRKHVNSQMIQLLGLSLLVAGALIVSIPILFGFFFPRYAESIPYAQIYSLTLIVLAAQLVSIILLSQRSTKQLYVLNIVNPIAQTLILVAGVYWFGLIGIIVAKVINQVVNLATSWTAVRSSLDRPDEV